MATSKDPADKINPEKTEATKPIVPKEQGNQPQPGAFQAQMDQTGIPISNTQTPQGISPMELAQPGQLRTQPTYNSLTNQVQGAQNSLNDIHTSLNDPNLKLKKSQQYLLRNKMEDANTHLQSVNTKLGANAPGSTNVPANSGPIEKFLGYVTDGQNQLESAQNKLGELQSSGQTMKPADMLLVQVKLAQAQQELNYSSIMLSSVVSGIKQFMNIQV